MKSILIDRFKSTQLSAVFVVGVSAAAHGHDGHGRVADNGHGIWHYLSEPIHFIPLALAGTLAAAVVYGWSRLRSGRLHSAKL